jgi:exosortase
MNQIIRPISENKIVPYLKFGLLAGLVILLYYPEITFLTDQWLRTYEFSHGFLIILVSCYLIWRKRDVLRSTPLEPNLKGFFIVLFGIALLVIGYAAFEPFVKRFSLIITIFGLVYFLLGTKIVKILLFPLGYLMFAIPPPHIVFKSLAVNLRIIDAKATYHIVNLLGIPIVREGPSLYLPNITLVVADFCTGILSLIALSAVAVLYAYMSQKHIISKTLLIVIAIPVAIMGNILRTVLVVVLAYFYGQSALNNVVHVLQGTVNFILTLVVLFILGNLVKKIDNKLCSKSSI